MVRLRLGFPLLLAVAVAIAAVAGDLVNAGTGYYW
jgi:hypothetical protein